MVKKTYTKPSMDEIKVDGMNLMAGSGSTCEAQVHAGGGECGEGDETICETEAKSGRFDFSNTNENSFDM
ncbi:hypothetical protein [Prevotella sp. AGR2160]|uniref:hypothetical protein n=1 Tax=Prevotella sp. AGR2160 TaxID=1280674 RepID=UPI000491E3CF|nr:hypothetical protein [Prevotella sp. AGR2160]